MPLHPGLTCSMRISVSGSLSGPGYRSRKVWQMLPMRPVYHPLAERALEKIDRAKGSSAESILEIPAELNSTAPART